MGVGASNRCRGVQSHLVRLGSSLWRWSRVLSVWINVHRVSGQEGAAYSVELLEHSQSDRHVYGDRSCSDACFGSWVLVWWRHAAVVRNNSYLHYDVHWAKDRCCIIRTDRYSWDRCLWVPRYGCGLSECGECCSVSSQENGPHRQLLLEHRGTAGSVAHPLSKAPTSTSHWCQLW